MSFVEPTPQECTTLDDLRKLFTWAGVPGNLRHSGTVAGSLCSVLELVPPAIDHVPLAEGTRTPTLAELNWRMLVHFANLDTEEFKNVTNNEWYYSKLVPADQPDDPEWVTNNPQAVDAQPAITKRGTARAALRAAKIICGVEKARTVVAQEASEDRAAAAAATAASAAATAVRATPPLNPLLGTQTAKLHQLVDEKLNCEVPLIEPKTYADMHDIFITVMHRPVEEIEEPSIHQMTAVLAILSMMGCFVDFARWGAYEGRTALMWKMLGMVPGPEPGTHVQIELKGPPDYSHWRVCWNVFQAALVMAGACGPAWLIRYADYIMKMNAKYSDASGYCPLWPFIFQTDQRFRREHFPRMLMIANQKLERMILNASNGIATLQHEMDCGIVVDFVQKKPFEYLWSLPEKQWWKDQFEDHAVMIALKAKTVDNFLGGDARIAANSAQHLASPAWAGVEAYGHGGYSIAPPAQSGPAFVPPAQIGKGEGKGGKAAKGKAAAAVKPPVVKAAENIPANRCRGFNAGSCNETGPKRTCPRNARCVHFCSTCGGKHAATECPQKVKDKKWDKNASGTWNAKKRKWNP